MKTLKAQKTKSQKISANPLRGRLSPGRPPLGLVSPPPSGRNLQGHFQSILVNFSGFPLDFVLEASLNLSRFQSIFSQLYSILVRFSQL